MDVVALISDCLWFATILITVQSAAIDNNRIYKVYPRTPLIECGTICSESARCTSFDLDPATLTCFLRSSGDSGDGIPEPTYLMPRHLFIHIEIGEWSKTIGSCLSKWMSRGSYKRNDNIQDEVYIKNKPSTADLKGLTTTTSEAKTARLRQIKNTRRYRPMTTQSSIDEIKGSTQVTSAAPTKETTIVNQQNNKEQAWFQCPPVKSAAGNGNGKGTINIAVNKTTSQSVSSTLVYLSGLAVDGNRENDMMKNSCTHTEPATRNWWQVDLGAIFIIDNIKIWNRGDCCYERLTDFKIFTGLKYRPNHEPRYRLCLFHPGTFKGWKALKCSKFPCGQFVKIQINNGQILSLCEVEVYVNI